MYLRSGTSNIFYSGDSYHSTAEMDVFSFDVAGYVDTPTGVAAIKFSGDSGISTFKFNKGKIYDPENRYVSSYRNKESFSISGNMSGEHYDYYINNTPVCFSGVKNDYKLQRFIIGATGGSLVTERIAFYSKPFGHKLSLDNRFTVSGKLTGLLESTGEYSSSKFEIFSGIVPNNDLINVSGFQQGPRTSSLITFSTTGTTQQHLDSGFANYENVNFVLKLYTNFGQINKEFSVQARPEEETIFSSGVSASRFLISGTGEQKQSGIYSLRYEVFENFRYPLTSKPLKISLDYASGDTGNYYSFSGIDLTYSGSGYSGVPDVIFTGDGLKMSPVVTPLMSMKLTGINVTYSGSGYSGSPTISISGGTPSTAATASASTNITGGLYSGMVTGVSVTNSGAGYDAVPSIIFSGVVYGGGIQASGTALMGHGQVTGITLNNPGGYLEHQPGLSGFSGGGAGATTFKNATGSGTISGYSKSFLDFWSLKTGESITGELVDYTNKNYITGYQSGHRIGYMDTGHTNVTGKSYQAVITTSGKYNDSGAMYANLNFHLYSGKIPSLNITGIR